MYHHQHVFRGIQDGGNIGHVPVLCDCAFGERQEIAGIYLCQGTAGTENDCVRAYEERYGSWEKDMV